MDDAWWRQPLTRLVAGRRVILAGGVAVGWTGDVELLRELGAESLLVLATEGRGAGPQPEAEVVAVEPAATDSMGRIRESLRTLVDPPAEFREALDRFDPTLGRPFTGYAAPTILGELRRHYRDTGWAVHVPRGAQELAQRIVAGVRQVETLGLEPTVAVIAEHTNLAGDVATADVIVTGEGRFDDQSLHGKVVSALAAGAEHAHVLVLAGQVTLDHAALAGAGIAAAHSITDYAGSVQVAMDDAARQLTGLAEQTSSQWAAAESRE